MSSANSSGEVADINSEEGTAARVRPISVEEILLRRKQKLNAEGGKGGKEETIEYSKNDDIGDAPYKDPERKENIGDSVKDDSNGLEEANSKIEHNHRESNDEGNIGSEDKIEPKANHNKSDIAEESNGERNIGSENKIELKPNHSKSDMAKENNYGRNIGTEDKIELKSYHSKSDMVEESNEERNKGSEVKIEPKDNHSKSDIENERNDEKQSDDRSRTSDKSQKDCEKNPDNGSFEKDKYEERDAVYRKEKKRKYKSHIDGKLRSVIEGSIPKRHDSGRSHDIEYSERKGRKGEDFRTRHEEPKRIDDGRISKKHDYGKLHDEEFPGRIDRKTEQHKTRHEELNRIGNKNRLGSDSSNTKKYVEYSKRKDERTEHNITRHEEPNRVDYSYKSVIDSSSKKQNFNKPHDAEYLERKDQRTEHYRTRREEPNRNDDRHRSVIDDSISKKHDSSKLGDEVHPGNKDRRNEHYRTHYEEPNHIDDKKRTSIDGSVPKQYDHGKSHDTEYLERKDRRNEHSRTYLDKTNYNDDRNRSKINESVMEKRDTRNSRDTKYLDRRDQKKEHPQTHHQMTNNVDDKNRSEIEDSILKIHDSDKVRDKEYLERKDGNNEHSRTRHENKDYSDNRNRSKVEDSVPKIHDSDKLHDTQYLERKDQKKDQSQAYTEKTSYKDNKNRSKDNESIPKKHDSRISHIAEYSEKKDRIKEHSRPHREEPKKRRSRSQEQDHESNKFNYDESDISRKRQLEEDSYSRNYRKNGSGLGGYSPRKRRTDSTVKSPPHITKRSPERKISTWDQPPSNKLESTTVLPPTNKPQALPSLNTISIPINMLVDSVQLTQATRPMRSLYIENLPPSVSEKSLIDCLNDFLLPSGVNQIQRAKPCISCIINKEKSQAVVEFLTPEDATSAICFNGRTLSGSVLKIRRPKDFVEAAAGPSEQIAPTVKTISEIVYDSPHKIFIGGISKALSSEMLREVVGAFGLLRAYHFEFNEELSGPCAFLEYEDHLITPKACAGLNGMKLGGHIITAAQAFLDFHGDEDDAENLPSYDVPSHAKSLLAVPTQVLQLKNMFNLAEFPSLSDSDLEEILEDIRLECTRFGTVKSINIARLNSKTEVATKICEQQETHTDYSVNENAKASEDAKDVANDTICNAESSNPNPGIEEGTIPEILLQVAAVNNKSEGLAIVEATNTDIIAEDENEFKLDGDGNYQNSETEIFETGCVLVEFLRKEAACAAAHCLHMRYYGDRIVMVNYIPLDLYLSRFPR